MSLVIVRCQRCGRRLGSLDAMPDDWSGNLPVARCRKCAIPTPGRIMQVLRRTGARGFAMGMDIPLAELRDAARKAQARGRPVSVDIPPIARPWW
jgi:hypothetical protein